MLKIIKFKWPAAIPCLPLMVVSLLSAAPAVIAYAFNISVLLTGLLTIPVLYIAIKSTDNPGRDLSVCLITLTSALFATHTSETHISIQTLRPQSYTQIRGIVDNVHFYHDDLNWESPDTSRTFVQIQQIFKDGKWLPASGNIQVNHRDEIFEYGDQIEMSGALFKYDLENEGIFNYGLYLKYTGVSHWLRLDESKFLGPASGMKWFMKKSYQVRDSIIARAGKGLKDEKDRKLLASMFFGYKGLLSPEEKEVFKRSGTVHLFAVSGLHVGIAAAFLLALLKILQINLKLRTVILLTSLSAYVVMTGSPPSAVRALVMISVWATARGFMLPSNGMNNIAFAAFLLIIANPLNLLSAGFYYTFIITAFLVATYIKSLDLFQILVEKKAWMGRSGWSSSFKLKIFQLFSCSVCAAVATFGLNILINGKVIPFSFLTNVFASILAWLSFTTAVFSLSGISFIYSFQEWLLDALRFTAINGEFSWSANCSIVLVLIFYLLLFWLPFTKSSKRRFTTAAAAALLGIFMAWPQSVNEIKIGVPSSSNVATVLIRNNNRAYLINCSSSKISKELFHERIDSLILPDIRADHIRFLETVLNNTDIHEIIIFKNPSAYLKRILKAANKEHLIKVVDSHPLIKEINNTKSGYEITFSEKPPLKEKIEINLKREELGKSELITNVSGRQPKEFSFYYSNQGYFEKISF